MKKSHLDGNGVFPSMGYQFVDIRKYFMVLMFHVILHLVDIFVEELQDEEGYFVSFRAVDCF
jgi:hypothetical protein